MNYELVTFSTCSADTAIPIKGSGEGLAQPRSALQALGPVFVQLAGVGGLFWIVAAPGAQGGDADRSCAQHEGMGW